jgi:hypothetical protein
VITTVDRSWFRKSVAAVMSVQPTWRMRPMRGLVLMQDGGEQVDGAHAAVAAAAHGFADHGRPTSSG